MFTYNGGEEEPCPEVGTEDGDDEGADEEEAAEEEDVRHGVRHGEHIAGWTHQWPAVIQARLKNDTYANFPFTQLCVCQISCCTTMRIAVSVLCVCSKTCLPALLKC